MAESIRVLVADDHAVVRQGIISALKSEVDISVIGHATNGREAIDRAIELKPDVVIMDIFMPICGGLEATSTLTQHLPETKVIVLTVSNKKEDLLEAVRCGARGYILKSVSIDDIATAVRQVAGGEAVLSPDVTSKLMEEFRQAPPADVSLSTREMEVLRLVGQGLTNREIAERLVVTQGTVKTYLQRVLDKLHLKNRTEAIAHALKRGLVNRQADN